MLELSRCHLCAAVVPDTPEDRKDHIGRHKHIDKRLDAMTRSLQYLNGEIERAHAAVEAATATLDELRQLGGTGTDSEALTINEFPDDETDDTDPIAEGDADLAPTFDAVTTDLADLHDITSDSPADDGLEARIATLNATGGPVA